tara:strand:- start:8 stop:364 length:357 start_codon:yes stop_codon:yes gene_type:complete
MIINAGRVALGKMIKGESVNAFTFIDVGDGEDSSSSSQTMLDHSVLTVRKTVTPDIIGSILVYTVDFTGSELGSNKISELGIFNASTGGDMLSRVTFKSIGPLAADETISFTFRLEVV